MGIDEIDRQEPGFFFCLTLTHEPTAGLCGDHSVGNVTLPDTAVNIAGEVVVTEAVLFQCTVSAWVIAVQQAGAILDI